MRAAFTLIASAAIHDKKISQDTLNLYLKLIYKNSNSEHEHIKKSASWALREIGKERCSTPHLTEDDIKEKFVTAFNQLFDIKDEVIENCETVFKRLTDTAAIDAELERIHSEIEVVTELTKKQQTSISSFDDILWQTTVNQVTVQQDGTLHFSFYNGAIIIV